MVALLTPALIGVNLIFKTGGIRADVKGGGVKKGPAEKGQIRYFIFIKTKLILKLSLEYFFYLTLFRLFRIISLHPSPKL